MKTKKLFIVFMVLILLVVLLVPVLADDVREERINSISEYYYDDIYNLPERFSLEREDALQVPSATRLTSVDYFYPINNAVQLQCGFSPVDYANIKFLVRDVANPYFFPDRAADYKNRLASTIILGSLYRYSGQIIPYNYSSSRNYPSSWDNSACFSSLFEYRTLDVTYNDIYLNAVAVYYTTNGIDFVLCTVDTDFLSLISSSSCTFVYVWNTGYNVSSMYSFFLSISSWVHDNTLLPLDIAERLVTIIFLTVFYLVVVRLPMYFLYMRDKEGRIRGKWVDVFYFCFCVSYMCAPLWIGVFNL